MQDCRVLLMENEEIIYEERTDIGPNSPFTSEIGVDGEPDLTRFRAILLDRNNRELISYQEKERKYEAGLPETVKPPAEPVDIEHVEELVLTGQRIMQFHNPRLDPEDYFLEAINRDPMNATANLLLGNLAAKDGRYNDAADYYRTTIHRITADYTRPRDCEGFYRLGVVLKKLKQYDAAIDTLYRATWDQAWSSPAYFELAGISILNGRFEEALGHLNHAISLNTINPEYYALKSAVLRHLGDREGAAGNAGRARELDPLHHMAACELLLTGNITAPEFTTLLNDNRENYLELATGYLNAGLYEEAGDVVDMALNSGKTGLSSYPILLYYGAWLKDQLGDEKLAGEYYASAAKASTDWAFPFRFETIEILEAAIAHNQNDARAWYFMGNILYDHQPGRAIDCWKQAVTLDPGLAIAYRNLGWGCYRYLDDVEAAIGYYEQAVGLNSGEPRYYLELDMLYELNNESLEKRYELFATHNDVVHEREDSYLREIEVLLLNGESDSVLQSMNRHTFLRQEGVVHLHDIFVDAHLLKGWELLQYGENEKALEHFLLADTYPPNQMIGRISGYRKEAQIYYLTGMAYQGMNKRKSFFRKAADTQVGNSEYLYYRALALQELGLREESIKSSDELIKTGQEALERTGDADYFAKFGEKARMEERRANAYYQMGLGYRASGKDQEAHESFIQAMELRNSILWARVFSEQ